MLSIVDGRLNRTRLNSAFRRQPADRPADPSGFNSLAFGLQSGIRIFAGFWEAAVLSAKALLPKFECTQTSMNVKIVRTLSSEWRSSAAVE